MNRRMFSEPEKISVTLPEKFTNALRLVHSTTPSSAEELRTLLELEIAKQYGHTKSTLFRIRTEQLNPPEFENSTSSSLSSFDSSKESTSNFTDSSEKDVGGKDEVPTISIPEEEQNSDGFVCKVCNESEIGPMILIKCGECGEHYHPLCHQPPVADAHVDDSDFVWCCEECKRKESGGDSSELEAPSKDRFVATK